MMITSDTGLIEVSYHQFWLVDTALPTDPCHPSPNGLIAVTAPGRAVVYTGIHSGRVTLTVQPRTLPPPAPDVQNWDEIIDISITAPTGHIRPAALMADVPHLFPSLCAAGPGDYRLRAHARGRDTCVDGVSRSPVETYLIIAWPAPPILEVIHRNTDQYGAGLRRALRKNDRTVK